MSGASLRVQGMVVMPTAGSMLSTTHPCVCKERGEALQRLAGLRRGADQHRR